MLLSAVRAVRWKKNFCLCGSCIRRRCRISGCIKSRYSEAVTASARFLISQGSWISCSRRSCISRHCRSWKRCWKIRALHFIPSGKITALADWRSHQGKCRGAFLIRFGSQISGRRWRHWKKVRCGQTAVCWRAILPTWRGSVATGNS